MQRLKFCLSQTSNFLFNRRIQYSGRLTVSNPMRNYSPPLNLSLKRISMFLLLLLIYTTTSSSSFYCPYCVALFQLLCILLFKRTLLSFPNFLTQQEELCCGFADSSCRLVMSSMTSPERQPIFKEVSTISPECYAIEYHSFNHFYISPNSLLFYGTTTIQAYASPMIDRTVQPACFVT